jgi:hypothetical protein
LQLVQDHIRAVTQDAIDASDMSIQIYGVPTEPMLAHMRELAGTGAKVTINRPSVAFDRFVPR